MSEPDIFNPFETRTDSATEVRSDGALVNVLTGLGTTSDRLEWTQIGRATRLSSLQQADLAQMWPIDIICAAKPDEATSKWCDIKLGGDDSDAKIIEAFNQYRDTIGGETEDEEMISDRDIFGYAGYLENVYGGSAIVINVEDGLPLEEPLDPNRIRTIRSLDVLDRYKIIPDLSTTQNPYRFTHYELLFSSDVGERLLSSGRLSKRNGIGYSYRIHRSRVIRFPGLKSPADLMLANQGWGRSLTEQVWEAFRDWKSVLGSTANFVSDASLFLFLVQNLREMVRDGKQEQLANRFRLLKMSATSMGGIAIDKDREEIKFLERQFGGLADLNGQFRDLLIGVSGMPHTILFGESPSGLGATGESEEKTWAKMVGQYQNNIIRSRLRRLYRLIWLAKDGPTKGKEPEGWTINFVPMLEESQAEKVGNLSSFTTVLTGLLQGGVILPEEARKSFEGPEPRFEVILDAELWEEKQKANEFDANSFGGFGGDTGAEGELPPVDAGTALLEPADEEIEEPEVRQESGDDLAIQVAREAKARFAIADSAYAQVWKQRRYQELRQQRSDANPSRCGTGRVFVPSKNGKN